MHLRSGGVNLRFGGVNLKSGGVELKSGGVKLKSGGVKLKSRGYQEELIIEKLYYNRYRWYNSETGCYISQDPIGLAGNNPTLYAYVHDTNSWVDVFGLNELQDLAKEAHSNLDKFAQKRRVTAVGVNEYGTLFVSSSTPKVDSKIVKWAEDNNITVVHSRLENVHAEEALARSNNGIIAIEASSKICIDCQTLMEEKNIKFETETTGKKSKKRKIDCKDG